VNWDMNGTELIAAGREWNDRGEGTGMPSQSPQESQGHPVDRGHGIEKSRSRSVSPANGLEARERAHKISSPQSMAGEKTPGERERHKDPKHNWSLSPPPPPSNLLLSNASRVALSRPTSGSDF
jgi:hypothetical protein